MSTVVTIPKVPSKYDIIPIHTSDIGNYKRCRRYWNWSSPARNNLRKRVGIYGINFPLWFGSGIHYGLEMFYNPAIQRDPVEAFQTWFQIQWEGGVVTEDWLDRTYDHEPVRFEQAGTADWLFKVRGLRDLHPNPDDSEFFAHRDLGIGMLTYYRDYYAPKYDDFKIIAAESVFSIPLGFEVKDIREQSPNYGKMLEVHARGQRDGVYQRFSNDKFGIIDHKTAAKIDEDYFLKLEKDEQVGNYHWASVMEAHLFDLPWKDLEEVCYNAIRKNFPKPPTLTTRGFPSLDRSKEGTTADLFMEFIRDNKLDFWYDGNEKAESYYNYLVDNADSLFVQRDFVHRNKHEVKATGEHIKMIAQEMLNDPYIYPNPTGAKSCTKCAFRAPCISADDGSDWQGMLSDGYERNRGR